MSSTTISSLQMGQESEYKTQLVLKICSISSRSVVCVHRLVSDSPNKAPFIDWYCILGVEENVGVHTIRKKYHKLALQLHPDKNKHPKAEIAFKLVSEAYVCLSDAAKRKAFNFKRHESFCIQCNRIPYTSTIVSGNSNNGSSFKPWNIISRSISSKVRSNIRDMRERLKEEAKVIENCLRANSMSKKESSIYNPADYLHGNKSQHRFQRESPVFNPSNYFYQGYPHHPRGNVYKNSETCCYLQAEKIVHSDKGGSKYASPVFEVKSQRNMMSTRKFAYVPSQC